MQSRAMEPQSPESPARNGARGVAVMVSLMLGVLMSAMDTTVIGTSMPSIIADLSGMDRYSWPFTAYLLCSTLAVPIFGSLADRIGRALVFVAGTAEFLVASALCGLSADMAQLIAFRGLQGLGGGVIVSSAFALVGESFSPRERGKYTGLVASMFGVSSVIGPFVGGVITDFLGWRWAFFVNLPLGVASILVLSLGVRGAGERRAGPRMDVAGTVLFAAFLVPFMIAISMGGRDLPWLSAPIAAMLSVSAVAFAFFVAVERRAAAPILPPFLFRKRAFVVSAAATFLSNATFYAGILFIPLYAQEVLRTSASGSAFAVMPMLVSYSLASVAGGRLISRLGRYRGLAVASSALAAAGMGALCLSNPSWGALAFSLAMAALGAGLGMTTPIFNVAPQCEFDRRYVGTVTSAIQFFRYIGSAVGSAIFGTLMIRGLSASLSTLDWGEAPESLRLALGDPRTLMNPSAIEAIGARAPEAYRAFVDTLIARIDGFIGASIHTVFLAAFAIAILSLAAVIAYRRGERIDRRPRA